MMQNRPKHRPQARRKGQRFTENRGERGITMTDENLTFIPADTKLRLLRDQMIVEPMDVMHSKVLIIPPHQTKLIRGKVVDIGPGHYPNRYNGPKGKRTKVMAGMVFVKTEVKPGQIVHLDGRNTGKAAFDAFYWGDKYCIHARQEDVAGIEA